MVDNNKKRQQLQKEYKKLNNTLSPFRKYLLTGSILGAIIVKHSSLLGLAFPIFGYILGSYKEQKKELKLMELSNKINVLRKEIEDKSQEKKALKKEIKYKINDKEYNKKQIENDINLIKEQENQTISEEDNLENTHLLTYK